MGEATQLEAEYCPPIDPALLFAIVSDFDLSTTDGIAAARGTLDQLKESALLEDATDFEPSGVGNHEQPSPDKDRSTLTSDGHDTNNTDASSLSNGFSGLSLSNKNVPLAHEHDLEHHDEDTKILLLIDVFGEQVKEDTIKTTLRKCKGNWNAAMEELLNQVYFDDAEYSDTGEKVIAKGIDGFAEERVSRRTRRRHKHAKRVSVSADSSGSDGSVSSLPSKWQMTKNDVDFITARTNVVSATVRSKYNQHGASKSQTINALLKDEMKDHKGGDDEATMRLAKELGEDFPTIAEKYLLSLIRISHPSTVNAHELAKALVARPKSSSKIVPQYLRPSENEVDGSSWQNVETKRFTASSASTVLGSESYASARMQAFAQASAAHRRAKSDRLMGGAAAYYSQLGRNYSNLSHSATASAADALVASQSGGAQIDLHGVDVLNGVRIAKQKTEQWWSGLGENRANGRLGVSQRGEAFRIVVGRGIHSEGGKSKLGPAVMKMLRSEGWKFDNEGAVLAVQGKQKH